MAEKVNIFNLDLPDFEALFKSWGEPSYRVKQTWQGMYQQLWASPEEMTSLPKRLRNRLAEHFNFSHLDLKITAHSRDKRTTKSLFNLPDKHAIETVLMRYENRATACISSQAGCALGCTFCATGQMGFRRNLTSGEIVEQVIHFARQLKSKGEKLTNVVLMGMGEPFQNYDAVMAAIDRLNHPEGFNMGARRFTVSTVGLIPGIRRFTKDKRQTGLAISLHAADDKLRASMLPINDRYPIEKLMDACRDYMNSGGRRITFEWALINDVNDMPSQAHKLAALLAGLKSHVNIIPLNPTKGFNGKRSTRERVSEFRNILLSHDISCTIRVRRGIDIAAGCGQLAESNLPEQPIQISG